MHDLSGASLVTKLYREVATKANNTIFLHPQLALCGLVHTVDEAARTVGYSHVPSMKNAFLLATHALLRSGRGQAVVFNGEWAPTLMQAVIASLDDTLSDGPLCWRDPATSPAVLQAGLHLLLLLGTITGRYSMFGVKLQLLPEAPPAMAARPSTPHLHNHSMPNTSASTHGGGGGGGSGAYPVYIRVATLWLYPAFLTSLRDVDGSAGGGGGGLAFALRLPLFQHVLAGPRAVLRGYFPDAWLDGVAGATEDPVKWRELTDLLSGLGFRGGAPGSSAAAAAAQLTIEGVLHAVAVMLLLLTTPFPPGLLPGLAGPTPDVHALAELLGVDAIQLHRQLRPFIDPATHHVVAGLAEAIYMTIVDWVAAAVNGDTPPYRLPAWPFTPESLAAGGVGARGRPRGVAREGVSVVVMPQATPGFAGGAAASGGGGGADVPLPPALALGVFLGNLAAEHLSIWAARTLLPRDPSATGHTTAPPPAIPACSLIDTLMAPRRGGVSRATTLEALLDGTLHHGGISGGAVELDGRGVVVAHTHGTIRYPLDAMRACAGEGTAHAVCEGFLSQLAGFLQDVLHDDAMFVLQVPLYLSTTPAAAGAPALYVPLVDATVERIDKSVFLAAAAQLFQVTQAHKARSISRERGAGGGPADTATSGPASPCPREQSSQPQQHYHAHTQRPRGTSSGTGGVGDAADGGGPPPPSWTQQRVSTSPSPGPRARAHAAPSTRAEKAAAAAGGRVPRGGGPASPSQPGVASAVAGLCHALDSWDRAEAGGGDAAAAPGHPGGRTPRKRAASGARASSGPASPPHAQPPTTPRGGGEARSASRGASTPSATKAAAGVTAARSPSARRGGGGGGRNASSGKLAGNPLVGSMDEMVHLTKAFRLRRERHNTEVGARDSETSKSKDRQASAAASATGKQGKEDRDAPKRGRGSAPGGAVVPARDRLDPPHAHTTTAASTTIAREREAAGTSGARPSQGYSGNASGAVTPRAAGGVTAPSPSAHGDGSTAVRGHSGGQQRFTEQLWRQMLTGGT